MPCGDRMRSAVSSPAMYSHSFAKNPFVTPRSCGVITVFKWLTRGFSGGRGQTHGFSSTVFRGFSALCTGETGEISVSATTQAVTNRGRVFITKELFITFLY